MSNDRYSDDQLNGYNGPTHSTPAPTAEEARFISMTQAERNQHIAQTEARLQKAAADAEEARFKADIEARTERALAQNDWYQMQQRGQLAQRVTVQNGRTTSETLNQKSAGTGHFAAPQALIDQVAVTIGGMNIGPKEARGMYERGEIDGQVYAHALNDALAPYGYTLNPKSFR